MKTRIQSGPLPFLLLFFAALFLFGGGAPSPVNAGEEDGENLFTYRQTFDDEASVNEDFTAAYVSKASGRSRIETVGDPEGHWAIEDGMLVRKKDIDQAKGTEMISVLTYKKALFTNFEVSVDYIQGGQTFYWACVGFRQSEEGKTFFDDGASVFVQEGGQITLWGSINVGGPFEKKVDNYDRNAVHTLRLVVQGDELTVYLDGVKSFEKKLQSAFYQEGYLSLMSVNNDSKFDNFSIRELPEPEIVEKPKPEPIPSDPSDPDSIDNMAEDKGDQPLLEREPGNADKESGCNAGGSAAASAAGTLLLAGTLLIRRW